MASREYRSLASSVDCVGMLLFLLVLSLLSCRSHDSNQMTTPGAKRTPKLLLVGDKVSIPVYTHWYEATVFVAGCREQLGLPTEEQKSAFVAWLKETVNRRPETFVACRPASMVMLPPIAETDLSEAAQLLPGVTDWCWHTADE